MNPNKILPLIVANMRCYFKRFASKYFQILKKLNKNKFKKLNKNKMKKLNTNKKKKLLQKS